MTFPDDVRYASTHEWAREQDGLVTVGITGYATDQLGDVVFVDLPAVGRKLAAGDKFGEIEAVKTVSDLYVPVAGEVVEVNTGLGDDPAAVNRDPYGAGWMLRLKPSEREAVKALLTSAAYAQVVAEAHP